MLYVLHRACVTYRGTDARETPPKDYNHIQYSLGVSQGVPTPPSHWEGTPLPISSEAGLGRACLHTPLHGGKKGTVRAYTLSVEIDAPSMGQIYS